MPPSSVIGQTPQLPFFAYGTLLPGQPNYGLWENRLTRRRPALLPGGRLYDLGNFPMLVLHAQGQVIGLLVDVQPDSYTDLLAQLDALEGFDPDRPEESVYRRVPHTVHSADGRAETAWVYVGRAEWVSGLSPLADGDWLRHSAEKMADMTRWWAAFGRNLLNQPAFFWTK